MELKHWHYSVDIENIAWAVIDTEKQSVNTLGREVLAELEQIVEAVSGNSALQGLGIYSRKPSGFVAGADVKEFETLENEAELVVLMEQAHDLFNRLEGMKVPVVVGIHGFCLGGGMELALACHYRVAVREGTRLGLPEVKLGLHPGFGGTWRVTKLVGGLEGMQMMLTGRNLRASKAKAIGLVDQLVDAPNQLHWALRKAILQKRRARGAGRLAKLTNRSLARKQLAKKMRATVAKKAPQQHYPAPWSLIDIWEQFGDDPKAFAAAEVGSFAPLMFSDTSKNLRRIFALTNRMKNLGGKAPKGEQFLRVHVIGAGVMGGDIAAHCVAQGCEVTLQDREMQYIEPALKRAKRVFQKRLKVPTLVKNAQTRLIADVDGKGIARADVVIEAIYENLDAKRELFKSIESQVKPDAILATNTSAIPLEDIASVLDQPQRLIGLHFFNPAHTLPLVEVVQGNTADPAWIEKGARFSKAIGKTPLVVKSAPGFLVNRVLAPYIMAALAEVDRGTPKEVMDKACVDFGMPMGPVELADSVGLDIMASVAEQLGHAVPEESSMSQHLKNGRVGRKKGEGYYRWTDGKIQRDDVSSEGHDLSALAEKLLRPMAEECQRCLDDGIVEDADLIDGGVIFGTGFAPFRGGPLTWIRTLDGAAS
ncbi:3-hydroxyacyl-CoA dehydrogenase NAD-binding domain-containing protein [Gammaproteobacteria bacterium]|nr:3-hydroxyacyl-CoA dehydrogenase NAD-binding domain-containing protein [Gammaproteobacteria bacterium]